MSSSKNLRKFLSGIQMRIDSQGFKFKVYSPQRDIVVKGVQQPFFMVDIENFGAYLHFINLDVESQLGIACGAHLKQIKVSENYLVQSQPVVVMQFEEEGAESQQIS